MCSVTASSVSVWQVRWGGLILVSVRFDKVRQVWRVVVRWFYGLLRCVGLRHGRFVGVRWVRVRFVLVR